MNESQPGWNQIDDRMSVFQLAILILSVVLLGMLAMDTFGALSPELSHLMQIVDTLACGVFWVDFGIRLYRAPNKFGFLKWGWIDLLASIPSLEI
jgi:voltage-gated potassium channel